MHHKIQIEPPLTQQPKIDILLSSPQQHAANPPTSQQNPTIRCEEQLKPEHKITELAHKYNIPKPIPFNLYYQIP